jgi:hypothetical protein
MGKVMAVVASTDWELSTDARATGRQSDSISRIAKGFKLTPPEKIACQAYYNLS